MLLLIVTFMFITLGKIQAHIIIKAKSFFIFLSFFHFIPILRDIRRRLWATRRGSLSRVLLLLLLLSLRFRTDKLQQDVAFLA